MALETGTYISDLVASNPAHSDPLSQTDAHIRLLKQLILATFPNINGQVTITDEQLNALAAGAIPALTTSGNLTVGGTAGITGTLTVGGAASVTGDLAVTGKITGNGSVPTGAIVDFLQSSIPTGWHELNGQAVSRTGATAGLFALYSTTYGVGDGSTTFNLPNFNDRYRRQRGTFAVGVFLEGAVGPHAHTGTTNATGVVGVSISDPGHAHTTQVLTLIGDGGGPPNTGLKAGSGTALTSSTNTTGISASVNIPAQTFTTDNYAAGGETRPVTVVVVTCVKA